MSLSMGRGAIGGQIAVRLANAGLDPLVVEPWDAQREAMQARGLTMQTESGGEEHAAPTTIAPHELAEEVSLLFLCVKSYDTMAALAVVKPWLADDGLLISMQNSINEEWIAPEVGAERTVGGVILVNGSPGVVPGARTRTGSGVGEQSVRRCNTARRLRRRVQSVCRCERSPRGGRARRFRERLARRTGRRPAPRSGGGWALPAPPSTPSCAVPERWSKMVNNTMLNPVSAVGGMRSAELLADVDARRIAVRLAAETMRVAEAEGHPLERIMGDYDAADVYALGTPREPRTWSNGGWRRAARTSGRAR